jgi:hypothetical protein
VDKPPRFTRAPAPCLFPRAARSWIDLPAATRTPYTQLSAAAQRISHLCPRFWNESTPSHNPACDRPAAGSTGAGRRAPPSAARGRRVEEPWQRGGTGFSQRTGKLRGWRSRAGGPRPADNTRGLVELRRHRSRCRSGAGQKTDRPRFLAGGQRSGLTREASVAISDDDGRPGRRGRAGRPRREPGRPRRS